MCKNLALNIRDCVSLCLSEETLKAVGPLLWYPLETSNYLDLDLWWSFNVWGDEHLLSQLVNRECHGTTEDYTHVPPQVQPCRKVKQNILKNLSWMRTHKDPQILAIGYIHVPCVHFMSNMLSITYINTNIKNHTISRTHIWTSSYSPSTSSSQSGTFAKDPWSFSGSMGGLVRQELPPCCPQNSTQGSVRGVGVSYSWSGLILWDELRWEATTETQSWTLEDAYSKFGQWHAGQLWLHNLV